MIELSLIDFYDTLFGISGIILTGFVFLYAIFFVTKIVRHKNREPWEFLLAAIVIFLIIQLLDLMKALDVFNVVGLKNVLQVIFLGTVLIAFITQAEIVKGKKRVKRIIYK